MDKQDELVAGILAHIPLFEGQPLAALRDHDWSIIAAAVRSFMGSDEAVERVARAIAWSDGIAAGDEALFDGLMGEFGDAYNRQARAALSAAIGEDIGGGRG